MILGIILIVTAMYFLYLKYRVVAGGEKSKGKVIGLASQNAEYAVGGVAVKKNTYILKIGHKKYHTAHGYIFSLLGKRNIGKETLVFKNERYGSEVFKCFDLRIEAIALLIFLLGSFLILVSLQ